MSSSKFANLEDVDFTSPDVYETHSPSPTRRTRKVGQTNRGHASTSSEEDSDEEANRDLDLVERSGRRGAKKVGGQNDAQGSSNPDIVGTALDPEEAAKRFQAATGIDSRNVDFSSVIQRRKKVPPYYPPTTFETTSYALGSGTGYKTSGGELGTGDEDPWTKVSAKESPIDRYRRLRYEFEELEKEVSLSNSGGGPIIVQPDEGMKEEEIPAGLLPQLTALKRQLASFDVRVLQEEEVSSSWTIETKRLLDTLSSNNAIRGPNQAAGEKSQTEAHTRGIDGGNGTHIVELDKRLAGLEELIGVRDALVDENNTLPRPLLPSIARIEHLLTLLTHPRHLDGISRRIKILVSELERLHEARRKLANTGGTLQPLQIEGKGTNGDASPSSQGILVPIETMQKLDTVLPTLSKLEPLIPLVPALLARLHSLTTLHASSSSFVEDMNSLEASMKRSNDSTSELKDMLKNLEFSFVENQSRIEANLKVVEARMENITQRVEKLQG